MIFNTPVYRHHILEIGAGAAFNEPWIFRLIQKYNFSNVSKLQFIDKHTFPDSSSDQYAGYAVANIKDEILKFLEKALKEKQPKDNCRI